MVQLHENVPMYISYSILQQQQGCILKGCRLGLALQNFKSVDIVIAQKWLVIFKCMLHTRGYSRGWSQDHSPHSRKWIKWKWKKISPSWSSNASYMIFFEKVMYKIHQIKFFDSSWNVRDLDWQGALRPISRMTSAHYLCSCQFSKVCIIGPCIPNRRIQACA